MCLEERTPGMFPRTSPWVDLKPGGSRFREVHDEIRIAIATHAKMAIAMFKCLNERLAHEMGLCGAVSASEAMLMSERTSWVCTPRPLRCDPR